MATFVFVRIVSAKSMENAQFVEIVLALHTLHTWFNLKRDNGNRFIE